MNRTELDNFYNDGFGWVCKRCERDLVKNSVEKSRLMSEGEAETKNPVLSNKALAKWADAGRNTLICPNCQTAESFKSNS